MMRMITVRMATPNPKQRNKVASSPNGKDFIQPSQFYQALFDQSE